MSEPGFLKASEHSSSEKAFLDADSGEWFTRGQLSSLVTAFADRLSFTKKALGFHFAFNGSSSLIAYLAAHRGLFFITGRKARFAKLFGWRISLDDVEERLFPHGAGGCD